MKKYIFLPFTIAAFVICSFFSVHPVFATNYSNCKCDSELNNGSFTCEGGAKFTCSNNTLCRNLTEDINGLVSSYEQGANKFRAISCVESKDIDVSCTCDEAGVAKDGHNGFTCTDSTGKKIQNYCGQGNQACVSDPSKNLLLDDNITWRNGRKQYWGKVAKGIACLSDYQKTNNTPVACHCDNPGVAGSGKNGFWCDGQTDKGSRMYCIDSQLACSNLATGSFTIDLDYFKNTSKSVYDQFFGHTATGIQCQNSDQVKTNQTLDCACSADNSFVCKGQGKDDNGKDYTIYCKNSAAKCIAGKDKSLVLDNDSGEVKVKGKNKDFDQNLKMKTAKGVTCGIPPSPSEPPPPSPPCIQGGWTGGNCKSLVTGLGELQTDPSGFTTRVFAILLSFSGGIALLLIIRAGYLLMTSQGKPNQVQEGRDQLIAAIIGLVFLIFSMVLLQVIGFDILRIPGIQGN